MLFSSAEEQIQNRHTGSCGKRSGGELRCHASRSVARSRAACRSSELRRDLIYHVDMARIPGHFLIGSVEPVDIGQQNVRSDACSIAATWAESVSLSPTFSSSIAIVSFSLMIGIAPRPSRTEGSRRCFIAAAVLKVTAVQKNLRARNLVRHQIFVYSSIRRPWPTAAAACLSAIFVGRFLKPRQGKACGDRTGGNENHMVACRLQRGKLGRNVPYFFSIHRSV